MEISDSRSPAVVFAQQLYLFRRMAVLEFHRQLGAADFETDFLDSATRWENRFRAARVHGNGIFRGGVWQSRTRLDLSAIAFLRIWSVS